MLEKAYRKAYFKISFTAQWNNVICGFPADLQIKLHFLANYRQVNDLFGNTEQVGISDIYMQLRVHLGVTPRGCTTWSWNDCKNPVTH